MSSRSLVRLTGMATERVSVSATIDAAPEAVFAVHHLANSLQHLSDLVARHRR